MTRNGHFVTWLNGMKSRWFRTMRHETTPNGRFFVMGGLVPATPLIKARPCHMIGVAGTSPAMTEWGMSHLIRTCPTHT
jgi:hypothetical protein